MARRHSPGVACLSDRRRSPPQRAVADDAGGRSDTIRLSQRDPRGTRVNGSFDQPYAYGDGNGLFLLQTASSGSDRLGNAGGDGVESVYGHKGIPVIFTAYKKEGFDPGD